MIRTWVQYEAKTSSSNSYQTLIINAGGAGNHDTQIDYKYDEGCKLCILS